MGGSCTGGGAVGRMVEARGTVGRMVVGGMAGRRAVGYGGSGGGGRIGVVKRGSLGGRGVGVILGDCGGSRVGMLLGDGRS